MKDENGKKLSGYQKKKIALAKQATISYAEEVREKTGNKEKLNKILEEIGPPPKDTSKIVMWANEYVAQAMYAVGIDTAATFEAKIKSIFEGARVIGMIRDKASEQEKIDRYISKVDKVDGSDNVAGLKAPIIKKPV